MLDGILQGVIGSKMWFPWEQAVLTMSVENQRPTCPAEPGSQSNLSLGRESWVQACQDRWEISLVVGPSRFTSVPFLPLECLITKQNPYFTGFYIFFNVK